MRDKKKRRILICVLVLSFFLTGISLHSWSSPINPPNRANINWQRFKGQRLDVIFSIHPWQEAIDPLIPEFEKLTGIKVRLVKLPEYEFMTKVPADLAAGTFAFDVFMTQYYDAPKYALEKWTEPLGKYVLDPSLTDMKWYDWADFFPGAQKIATAGGTYEDRVAITAESQVLIYRKDIFNQLGLNMPQTFKELLETANTVTQHTKIYGITLRGRKMQCFWPDYGVIKSYGGDYFSEEYRPVVNSPETITGVKMYRDLCKYAPPGITGYGWDEINTAMLGGMAAMFLDSSVIYSRLQDPTVSKVVNKVAVAPFPKGPAGRIPHSHYWSISINSTSKKKKAAWLFIEWATSKYIQLKLALKGVAAPRLSVWENSEFVASQPKDFVSGVMESLKTAVISRPHVRFFELIDVFETELQKIILGQKQVEPALNDVQKTWKKELQY